MCTEIFRNFIRYRVIHHTIQYVHFYMVYHMDFFNRLLFHRAGQNFSISENRDATTNLMCIHIILMSSTYSLHSPSTYPCSNQYGEIHAVISLTSWNMLKMQSHHSGYVCSVESGWKIKGTKRTSQSADDHWNGPTFHNSNMVLDAPGVRVGNASYGGDQRNIQQHMASANYNYINWSSRTFFQGIPRQRFTLHYSPGQYYY